MVDVEFRLREYLKSRKLPVYKFEKACGFANGWVSDIRVAMKFDAIEKIAEVFPDLNLDWLFTGRGKMTRPLTEEEETEMGERLSLVIGNNVNTQTVVIGNLAELKRVVLEAIMESRE